MPGNGTSYSRADSGADSRAEIHIFIRIKRKPEIQLAGWHISLTFIDNISGISPTVIFGNKIQIFFLVTSDVTSDIWTVTSYVTDRSLLGLYVHGRLSCL